MQSPSSEGAARETSWQWDEAGGGAEAPGDVIGGGGGPRLSRRGVLVGAGVLAAGGAAWAFAGSGGDGPKPQPTALSGPKPLWTYRGPEAMTPERLVSLPRHPAYLSKAGLQVLDPVSGDPRRLLVFDPPRPADWPSDLELPGGKVVLGPEHLLSATSRGHIDAHHLTDPGGDWSEPLPDELQGQTRLAGVDGIFLYGSVWGDPRRDGTPPEDRVFALRLADHSFDWTVRTEGTEQPVTPATGFGLVLACVRSLGGRTQLVAREAFTGRELWTAPGAEDLRWCVTGLQELLVPDGNGGVRMVNPTTGGPGWSHSPARGESWRALPPVLGSAQVFVPRDDGVVSSHDPSTGAVLWTCRLPFLLDRRSRPLAIGGTLFVPGPAAGGVGAIDTATGRLRWTFRDSGPGRDVWTVSTDGSRLYAGHDDVLHALPLN
ncbi:PQQ-binding-like beta-propeller repeat protein [Kitasatospora sp. SUK 42]|uniref:outer membrane protein assembly factor BamB family protein n=1 Tax=Kitasatospora sp. SUK 42 TaxID=1588882 RepID=UPI0018CAFD78|nr:PQQ-binding-like beta-propeller repeat protein [Kitasatospora sp. SUK 42]MBV2155015.1 PQQ-like beta-propeller repeat protein [Kitasatospora sp. SUK 42]